MNNVYKLSKFSLERVFQAQTIYCKLAKLSFALFPRLCLSWVYPSTVALVLLDMYFFSPICVHYFVGTYGTLYLLY